MKHFIHTVNYLNIIKINIHKNISSHAKKVICRQDYGEELSIENAKHILDIIPLKKTNEKLPDSLKVDSFFQVNNDSVLEKCKYKFSSWKYLIKIISPTHWVLAVSGDFCSSWVWPYRTLGNILKFLAWKNNYFLFHAAGFYNGKNAVMVLAPGGTGKTLTTIHFLCNNGQIYNDDTVAFSNNKLIATAKGIAFWSHRYKNNPEALPANMPQLNRRDKFREHFRTYLKTLSLGTVHFSQALSFEDYWQNAVPPSATVNKIIALQKSSEFAINDDINDIDIDVLKNRLLGDLEFQSLPLLRLADVFKVTGIKLFDCEGFFRSYRKFLNEIIENAEVISVSVPPLYTRETFKQLNELIHK